MDSQLSLFGECGPRGVPTFGQTLAALGDLPGIFYRALEIGTSQNLAYFQMFSGGERPRPHVREMIVRDQARRYLAQEAFQVKDERVRVASEPLAALSIRCGRTQIRILKGPGGVVPGCGTSKRRRKFYGQGSDLFLDQDGKVQETKLNILFLWDFDNGFNLDRLWMACPLRAGKTADLVLTHWCEEVPHPAEMSKADPISSKQAMEAAELELERLLSADEEEEPGKRVEEGA